MDSADEIARECLRPIRGAVTDDQYIEVLDRVKRAIRESRLGQRTETTTIRMTF